MGSRATAPDVRVRLSAEGVQEVVNALKRIQSEAEKSGRGAASAGKGFSSLTASVGSLTRLMPQLAAAASITGAAFAIKSALDYADGLGKLNQKSGVTVETLSTLASAARTADVSQEQLSTGVIKAARFFDQYDQGASKARNAVRQLFGSSKALEGLNTDERLKATVNQLAKLEAGSKKTGLAQEVFSKSGAEMLPLIDDLGGKFDEAAAKAKALGLSVDEDLARAAQEANDAMTDLKSLSEGMTLQFTAGLAPALTEVAEGMLAAFGSESQDSIKTLGTIVGEVIKFIAKAALGLVATLGFVAFMITSVERSFLDGISAMLTGKKGPKQAFTDFIGSIKQDAATAIDFIGDRISKADALMNGANRANRAKRRRRDRTEDHSQDFESQKKAAKLAQEIIEARRKMEESARDHEVALTKATLALKEDSEKRAYDKGLRDLDSYYAGRRQRIEQQNNEEVALLQEKLRNEIEAMGRDLRRPLEEGETTQVREKQRLEHAKAIGDLQSQIQLKRIDGEGKLAALAAEQADDVRQLYRDQLDAQAALAEAEGNRWEAARIALEQQIAGMERLRGETDAQFGQRQTITRTRGQAGIDFDKAKAEAEAALQDFSRERQLIDDQVQQGILFQFQGTEKLHELEKQRLATLQALAQAALAAARATNDPEKIAQAQELVDETNRWAQASEQAQTHADEFKQTLEQAFDREIFNFLTDGIENFNSFGDAVRGVALGVVDSLRRMAAEILTAYLKAQLLKGLGKLFGGVGGFSDGGQVEGFAGGGHISSGPGTSTSDSILARLSRGEFVVRAAVVRQPGVLDFLHDLNGAGIAALRSPRTPGFADGGVVDFVGEAAEARDAAMRAVLDIDEVLLLKRIEASPEFSRVVVRTVEKNPKKVRQALGSGSK
jgi:hypothetical protein